MTFKAELKIDKTTFEQVTDAAINGPKRVFQQFGNVVASIGQRTINKLSDEPGKPRYPLRWTSEKQRNFVMALLRRKGQIPYVRTGKYAASWEWQSQSSQDGGLFVIENTAKTAKGESLEQYVQGINQQGFHRDTGWVRSEDILKDAAIEAELALAALWEEEMAL
jgi:hypothetical protein